MGYLCCLVFNEWRTFGKNAELYRNRSIYTLYGYEATNWFFFHASVTCAFFAVGAAIQQRLEYASFRIVAWTLTGTVYACYCVIRAVYVWLWVGVWFAKQSIQDMR